MFKVFFSIVVITDSFSFLKYLFGFYFLIFLDIHVRDSYFLRYAYQFSLGSTEVDPKGVVN